MITVLRRWFIPKEKVEEFGQRWLSEIVPELVRQPGFVRAEVYTADVQGHWVSSLSWDDEQSRSEAAEHFAELYNEFERYERFAPETLTLVSEVRNRVAQLPHRIDGARWQ
jgi:hypothetical protein